MKICLYCHIVFEGIGKFCPECQEDVRGANDTFNTRRDAIDDLADEREEDDYSEDSEP